MVIPKHPDARSGCFWRNGKPSSVSLHHTVKGDDHLSGSAITRDLKRATIPRVLPHVDLLLHQTGFTTNHCYQWRKRVANQCSRRRWPHLVTFHLSPDMTRDSIVSVALSLGFAGPYEDGRWLFLAVVSRCRFHPTLRWVLCSDFPPHARGIRRSSVSPWAESSKNLPIFQA